VSRRVKVLTAEKGPLEILVVWSAKGIWEPEWEPLRETQWAELLTIVHPEVMEHALRGWSRPLVLALGLPPEGALRKIPVENRQCSQRGPCPLYDPKQCQPVAKELPWCFEPEGFSPGPLKDALVRLIQIWHEAVYVVVTHAD
jgi:hypothetical protein